MNRRELLRGAGLLLAWPHFEGGRAEARGAAHCGADGPSSAALASDARPWLYSFWVDGNVSKDGITADLEAMRSAGLGGMLFMDGSLGMPRGPCRFMSGPWREQFRHMVREASRLGLSINLNNAPGWAGSGGPWIAPQAASQVLVHSQLVLQGPMQHDSALPAPNGIRHGYYRDVAILAYRLATDVPGYRIEDYQSSKSFAGGQDFEGVVPWPRFIPTRPQWPALPPEQMLDESSLQDLTSSFSGGRLRWRVPPGKWLVLRFGHTVSNGTTRMAQAEASGLECDKLSAAAAQRQFAAFVGKLADSAAAGGGKVIVCTHIDSWEAGSGNWTAGFREEFRLRRGYDLLPYMATLAGFVVGSLERSERFLWDLRETVAELLLQRYAGQMGELAHARGMRLSIEGYDAICDDLRYSGRADEPMGEFWRSCYSGLALADTCETAASAAHVYGRRIVGAESFTALRGDYMDHPATLKPFADWALCAGINRLNFSEWVFQPWTHAAPGLCFGPFGTPFARTLTWWPQAKPWHRYLERCQRILREGQFVADICFVTPEGAPYRFAPPIPATTRGVLPCRPAYNFDGCPPELVGRMTVEDGEVVLPSGMRYRLLVLPTFDAGGEPVIRLAEGPDYAYKAMPMPRVRTMTPVLLRHIKALVEQGATVLGWRPLKSPSLSGFPDCDIEVARLADELWGPDGGRHDSGERRVGAGRVCWGRMPEAVLSEAGVPADFGCSPNLQGMLNYMHRRTEDGGDVYFIVNKSDAAIEGTVRLRVQGKEPKILRPHAGDAEPLPFFRTGGGVTEIPVSLHANESVFFLFGNEIAADPVVAIRRNGGEVWPRRGFELPAVEASDDRFIMAAWVGWIAPQIRLPSQQDGRLAYDVPLHLPGPGIGTFTSPGQGRAGFVVGANGIVVFRYSDEGRVEPLLAHAASIRAPIHVGVVYEGRVARLFLNGALVKTGPRAPSPLRGCSGWEDRRPFAIELAALQQFEDMLASAGIRKPGVAASAAPVVDFSHGLIWAAGSYRLQTAAGRSRDFEVVLPRPAAVAGPWAVEFDARWGGPGEVRFEQLDDWSTRTEPGIRYYSGTARYRTRFSFARRLAPGVRAYLDLGRVADIAEINLNGTELGVLWNPPCRLDVTDCLRAANELEVRVTNRWVNRLIGDAHLAEDARYDSSGAVESWPDWLSAGKRSPTGRYTFTSQRVWRRDDPLIASGLLGPVRLRYAFRMEHILSSSSSR